MYVGVCLISLHIPENRSLKGKRQVIRSMCGKLRSRFEVSVAEVEGQDKWQAASIGVAAVSGSAPTAGSVIEKIIEYVELNFPDVQVTAVERDVLDLS